MKEYPFVVTGQDKFQLIRHHYESKAPSILRVRSERMINSENIRVGLMTHSHYSSLFANGRHKSPEAENRNSFLILQSLSHSEVIICSFIRWKRNRSRLRQNRKDRLGTNEKKNQNSLRHYR